MSAAFQGSGIDYETLDAVVLSHMHSDHVGGFSMFVQSLWLNQRRRPLPVYAPARAVPALKAWLEATVLPAGLIGFELQWHALEPDIPFQIGSVMVTAFPTTHLDSLRRSFEHVHPIIAFEAFSFLLDDSNRRVGHTADIGQAADLDLLLAARPSLLVSELSHIELGDLAARVRGAELDRIIFVHVARALLENLDQLENQLRNELEGLAFALARDDDVYSF